jgi:hypothetical protein
MARKRMLDPAWIESHSLGKCSVETRLLFIGLITLADDAGRVRGDPRYIKSMVFPYDNFTVSQVIIWLTALQTVGSIRIYEAEGGIFIDLPKFNQYQYIQRKQPSKLPEFTVSYKYDTSTIQVPPKLIELNSIEFKYNDVVTSNVQKQKIPAAPASDTQKPKKPKTERSDIDKKLFNALKKTFSEDEDSKKYFKTKTDFQREVPAIWRMIDEAKERTGIQDDSKKIKQEIESWINVYDSMIKDSKHFLFKQPYRPSNMMSKGIFPQIIQNLEESNG